MSGTSFELVLLIVIAAFAGVGALFAALCFFSDAAPGVCTHRTNRRANPQIRNRYRPGCSRGPGTWITAGAWTLIDRVSGCHS